MNYRKPSNTIFTAKNIFAVLFPILLTIFHSSPVGAQKISADLVIVNARVRTMDDSKPLAEAVAVINNRIVAVGGDADIKNLIGANTKTIDARGKLLLPGFNDAHVHFLESASKIRRRKYQVTNRKAKFFPRKPLVGCLNPSVSTGERLNKNLSRP